MAIDTAEKRRSVAGVSVGWGITPNSAKDAEWRAQVAWNYSGITFTDEQPQEPEEPVVAGDPRRRWYIYPDGTRRWQTPEEAERARRQYNARLRRRKASRARAKVEEAVKEVIEEEGEEPILVLDTSLFDDLNLPPLPNIEFDFAPPPRDDTALMMIYLRSREEMARIARRRAKEEALLALLFA